MSGAVGGAGDSAGGADDGRVEPGGTQLSIRADGDVVVAEGIGAVGSGGDEASVGQPAAGPLAGWDDGYRTFLGDEPGGERGWRGEVRTARVQAGSEDVDLLAPGVLRAGEGPVVRTRVDHLLDPTSGDPVPVVLLRFAAFVPIGAVLRLRWRRRRRAAALAALAVVAVAVVLTLGKLFVAGRHPFLADSLVSAAGGLVGTWVVGLAPRRGRGVRRAGGAIPAERAAAPRADADERGSRPDAAAPTTGSRGG